MISTNFMEVLHKVFLKDNEEWVADSSMTLTSNPPKNNIYRLSDKKHDYMFCHEIFGAPFVKWMTGAALYNFLNPNSITSFGSSGVTHSIELNDAGLGFDSISGTIKAVPLTTETIYKNPNITKVPTAPTLNLSEPKGLRPYMTVEEARFVENLRAGKRPHSYRAVSEAVHKKYPHLVPQDAVGHQWQGEEMVDVAFSIVEGMEAAVAAKDPSLRFLIDKWYL